MEFYVDINITKLIRGKGLFEEMETHSNDEKDVVTIVVLFNSHDIQTNKQP